MGLDKNSFITDEKRNKKNQLFRGNHPPLPTSRPMLSQPLSNGYLLKNRSSHSFCYWGWHYSGSNIPLINLGQLCPFPICCSSQSTCYEGRVGAKIALTSCESAQQNLKHCSVFTVLVYKTKTQHNMGCYEKN